MREVRRAGRGVLQNLADGHHPSLLENYPSLRAASRAQVLGSHGHTGGAVDGDRDSCRGGVWATAPQVLQDSTVRGTHLVMLSQHHLQTMSRMLLLELHDCEKLSHAAHTQLQAAVKKGQVTPGR